LTRQPRGRSAEATVASGSCRDMWRAVGPSPPEHQHGRQRF
jgi:hypothetical protein